MNSVARLAVPAFFTLIAEPAFLLVDSAVVGHLGTVPLAALGAASAVLLTATGVFVFLAYATTSVVARHLGAGHRDDAIQAGLDGAWLGLFISLPVATGLALAAHPLAEAMGGRAVADTAAGYLHISALGIPAMLLSLAVQGLLRGLQDTRTPLVVTTVGFALNTVLNVWFVLGWHLGLNGSALGTVIAQWLMTIAMLTTALSRARHLELRPRPGRVLASARFGLPLLVRTVALRAVLLVTTALAGALGTRTLAAHQIVSTLFSFLTFALDAVAIAAQSLVGESLGRGDRDATRTMTTRLVRYGWWSGVAAGVILLVGAPFLPALFTGETSIRHAVTFTLVLVAIIQPAGGVLFVLDGILMGAGDGPFLARAQVGVLLGYLPLAGVLAVSAGQLRDAGPTWSLLAVWAAYALYLMARTVLLDRRRRGTGWMRIEVPAT